MLVYINNNLIPKADIKKQPTYKSQWSYGENLVSAQAEVVLGNANGQYSDMNALSIFYGTNWYGSPVLFYDDVNDVPAFAGKVVNIVQSDNGRTVTVKASNYIQDLANASCVYTCTDKALSQAMLEIIQLAVPDEYINLNGFLDASAIETTNSVLVNVSYDAKDNIKCLNAIQELARIGQIHLYTKNNIIHAYKWKEYDGRAGSEITTNDIFPASFSSEYADKVQNAYYIAYKNSTSVSYASGIKSGTSGEKVFTVPNQKMQSSTASDYKILLSNTTGATYCGANVLNRYANPTKILSLTVSEKLDNVDIGELKALTYGDYTREPFLITSIEPDSEKHTKKIKGEFVNLPVNYVTRDIEPPTESIIDTVLPLMTGVFVRYSECLDVDFSYYKLYFASTVGNWDTELSHLGRSPITARPIVRTPDGFRYTELYQLNPGVKYYTKISTVDTLNNESDTSEIKSANAMALQSENWYMCQGHIYTGVTLDNSNAKNGTPLSGQEVYGTAEYDTSIYGYTATYESFVFAQSEAFSRIQVKAQGLVYLSVSESVDGITWGSWSTHELITPQIVHTLSNKYFKLRLLFASRSWADTDRAYITEVI